ncbi:MAG: SH3 domain-containing protein [Anaerolineae bacterium]|nr:SH3 domain-containing protein [Anaerolineae bacterium]
MSARGTLNRFCLALIVMLLFAGAAQAQNDGAPIQIGQNAVGTLSADVPDMRFALSAFGGETATIQVLALSPGFVPRFRVTNPAGVEILIAPNPSGLTSLENDASFPDAGTYLIEVSGENGSTGQFVLSLQPGAALPEPVDLAINQSITDTVGGNTSVRLYRFATPSDDALVLAIFPAKPDTGVLVSLYDEDAARTVASHDATLGGVAYQLPAQQRHFRLEVRAGGAEDSTYSICLGNCGNGLLSAETTAEPQVVEVAETPEVVAAICTVASTTGGSINVRSGPGTQYTIVGNLAAGTSLPALGQLAGGSWFQVNVNGDIGWVAASVTRLDGDCGSLPTVAAPVGALLAPTQAPPTNPPPPSSGSSSAPTATIMPTTAPSPEPPAVLPDITGSLSYAVMADGGTIEVGYSIIVRDVTTPVSYRIRICADDTCTFENGYANTPLSSGTSLRFAFTPDATRIVHRATLTVDSDNVVAESNEGNNVSTINFQS